MSLLTLKKKADDLKRKRSRIAVAAMSKIQPTIDEIDRELKAVNEQISETIESAVKKMREEKKTGTINIIFDGVEIKHSVTKKVVWDQRRLRGVRDKIKAAGDDPDEYIDMKLFVSENKYKSWPGSIKNIFEPARTEKPGKPKTDLTIVDDDPGLYSPLTTAK
jgi:hypothetical protein